jgi:hypothetical protein
MPTFNMNQPEDELRKKIQSAERPVTVRNLWSGEKVSGKEWLANHPDVWEVGDRATVSEKSRTKLPDGLTWDYSSVAGPADWRVVKADTESKTYVDAGANAPTGIYDEIQRARNSGKDSVIVRRLTKPNISADKWLSENPTVDDEEEPVRLDPTDPEVTSEDIPSTMPGAERAADNNVAMENMTTTDGGAGGMVGGIIIAVIAVVIAVISS